MGALEHVLGRFIDAKRVDMDKRDYTEAVIEVGLAVLEEFDGDGGEVGDYPNRDTWLRFNYSRDDLIALVGDMDRSDVGKFVIEQMGDSESGLGEEDEIGTQWASVNAIIGFDYSSAALTLRFRQDIGGGPVDCTCWVRYAEGDGDDMQAIAAFLESTPGA